MSAYLPRYMLSDSNFLPGENKQDNASKDGERCYKSLGQTPFPFRRPTT